VVGLCLRASLEHTRGRRRPCLKHCDGAGLLWVGLDESSHAVPRISCGQAESLSYREIMGSFVFEKYNGQTKENEGICKQYLVSKVLWLIVKGMEIARRDVDLTRKVVTSA